MMRPLVLLLLAAAPLTVGCGDLSQEDLLFRAAIPAKEALEVRPAGAASDADGAGAAGTETQAMEVACEAFDVKCQARNVSFVLNSVTFTLLDLVDRIVSFPPSQRERGRRVWGPFFDFDSGATSRFEMVRTDGGAAYRFCLHSVAGRIADRDARDVTCDTDVDDDTGLTLLLEGTFSPGDLAGARARSGVGSMLFHTGRLPGELAAIGRTMAIDFDNEDDETNVTITVEGQRDVGSVFERDPISYEFRRDAAGAGTFGFVLFADVHQDDENAANLRRIERLDIVAQWNADQAGRGVARVREGDLGAEEFTVDQCWDSADAQVYRGLDFSGDLEDPFVEGDEGRCEVPLEDVAGLLPET